MFKNIKEWFGANKRIENALHANLVKMKFIEQSIYNLSDKLEAIKKETMLFSDKNEIVQQNLNRMNMALNEFRGIIFQMRSRQEK